MLLWLPNTCADTRHNDNTCTVSMHTHVHVHVLYVCMYCIYVYMCVHTIDAHVLGNHVNIYVCHVSRYMT